MSVFFVSDTHFFHSAIIKYCNRPFNSIEEMNEKLIENWNNKVTNNDTIYHLGDFGFGNKKDLFPIFNRLNGNKVLIKGNHDRDASKLLWTSVHDMLEIKVNDKVIQLCHYPMRTWNKSFHGSWHIHGHTHGTLSPHMWSCDVGVDCWNFSPISFNQLEDLFKLLPRNKQGEVMPSGVIWNATRHMAYGFNDFFVGDGSMDNVDPDTLFKKDI